MSYEEDAEKLRTMLWKLNLLNREAAEYLGVTERTIYWWLSGTKAIPKMAFLALKLKRLQK